MSNVQSAKTARVDLLDDKKSIILTIGAADKTVTKFELTNDAASQLVSMIVMVAGHAPGFSGQPIEVTQPIPTSNIGWGTNNLTGEIALIMVVGHLKLSFLVQPEVIVRLARDIVSKVDELPKSSGAPKN